MVQLTPMDSAEFGPYMERLIKRYGSEHVRTGRWTEQEGPTEARKEIERVLPSGLHTPNNFIFAIVSNPSDPHVGTVWLAIEPRGGFVYDLEISEAFRRKGYAEAAMRLLEPIARAKGASKLSLHVFGDNHGARALYRKLGYSETNVAMSKALTQ